jgi:protein gp37
MSAKTSIQWTEATWNPTTGCTKVSEGCRSCYIERTPSFRMAGRTFVNGSTGVRLHPDRLDAPLHWRKPRRVFVNSMSDLFHEDVPEEFIAQVFLSMNQTNHHIYQILTKRPQRMLNFSRKCESMSKVNGSWPMPNVWLGVSVEDQATADERIPILLQTPAAVRWISAEPLLGPIQLTGTCSPPACFNALIPGRYPKLDWVVVGGESGPGARPCDLAWIRMIKNQCQAAKVPVFVKQLGREPFVIHKTGNKNWIGLKDKKGGDIDEWPKDLRVREFPR